jgi:hypothetical protein
MAQQVTNGDQVHPVRERVAGGRMAKGVSVDVDEARGGGGMSDAVVQRHEA